MPIDQQQPDIETRLKSLEQRVMNLEARLPQPEEDPSDMEEMFGDGKRDTPFQGEQGPPPRQAPVNPLLPLREKATGGQGGKAGWPPKSPYTVSPTPPRPAPTPHAQPAPRQSEPSQEVEVGGFGFAVEEAFQRERERNPELKGDWLGNVTKDLSREITATGQNGLAPSDMQFPRKRQAVQQRQEQATSARDSAQQLLEQPTVVESAQIGMDHPQIVNPTPLGTDGRAAEINEQVQRLRENLNKPTQDTGPAKPPSVNEQVQRMRENLNDRPDPAIQPERDPHVADAPSQDAPQYEFADDTPDRDMQVAKQNVAQQARTATVDERQRRVQDNAVERQAERRNRIQQGRDGLPADERTPEEKFNEALEVARQRSPLQGEARQRFDRQQQRQQQASGFDSGQAFEGSNQFVPPRAHEAIPTRPGRETDGLPHETFGKSVVDATKASVRAMERLSGELGEALARIEQIERDIELRGHA